MCFSDAGVYKNDWLVNNVYDDAMYRCFIQMRIMWHQMPVMIRQDMYFVANCARSGEHSKGVS